MKDPKCPWGGCKMMKGLEHNGMKYWVCTIHLCEVRKVGK